jgi:hypothetical protein
LTATSVNIEYGIKNVVQIVFAIMTILVDNHKNTKKAAKLPTEKQ